MARASTFSQHTGRRRPSLSSIAHLKKRMLERLTRREPPPRVEGQHSCEQIDPLDVSVGVARVPVYRFGAPFAAQQRPDVVGRLTVRNPAELVASHAKHARE